MTISLDIKRYDPTSGQQPAFVRYTVDVVPTDRILDALMQIKRNQDGSLAFRKSCAHGVCGSDAMIIDGIERLACKTLVRDVVKEEGAVVSIEPLKHLPVQKDLMVDQAGFFGKFRAVRPYLITEVKVKEKERFQSQEERASYDDPTKCILCSACFSACPVLEGNQEFLGPAAIVAAGRFVFDSRDEGLAPRLDVLNAAGGVWPCENHFSCTQVCPRGIKITKLINQTKREIRRYREQTGGPTA